MDVLRNTLLFLEIASCVLRFGHIFAILLLMKLSRVLPDCCLNLEKNYLSAFDARTNCSVIKINSDPAIRHITYIIQVHVQLYSVPWILVYQIFLFIIFISFGGGSVVSHGIA